MTKFLSRMRANLNFLLATKGAKPSFVALPEIPKKWEVFPGSKDEWINIEFPTSENSSGCLYSAKAGSFFPPHFHDVFEQGCILSEGGKMKLYTNTRTEIIEFPNGVYILPKEVHAVEFLVDMKVLWIWHPKFEDGWNAGFIE